MKRIQEMFDIKDTPLRRCGGIFFAVVAISFSLVTIADTGSVQKKPRIDERTCVALTTKHFSYEIATRQLMRVSEVQHWKTLVEKNNRHIALLPSTDSTTFHTGQCFWEISLYENFSDRLLRWHAYQIGVDKPLAYRVDIANPDQLVPVSFLPKNKNRSEP